MADKFGDFFLSDADDELLDEDDEVIIPPVVVPSAPAAQYVQQPPAVQSAPPQPAVPANPSPVAAAPASAQPVAQAAPPVEYVQPMAPVAEYVAPAPARQSQSRRPVASARKATREERLAEALNQLMQDSQEIEAAALVSLDGFTMASALPDGMHEDRVGAMSAAILGLGERAAAELGRGQLSQVFIEGESGYVLLMAAGERAVLTCLADPDAKLGLVLYDMRMAASLIGEILG